MAQQDTSAFVNNEEADFAVVNASKTARKRKTMVILSSDDDDASEAPKAVPAKKPPAKKSRVTSAGKNAVAGAASSSGSAKQNGQSELSSSTSTLCSSATPEKRVLTSDLYALVELATKMHLQKAQLENDTAKTDLEQWKIRQDLADRGIYKL